uniref:Uncharacterized protein n=1 Tax=Salix viminalis TaxID=40686 RepID=A0A6N2KQL7_SALVM
MRKILHLLASFLAAQDSKDHDVDKYCFEKRSSMTQRVTRSSKGLNGGERGTTGCSQIDDN